MFLFVHFLFLVRCNCHSTITTVLGRFCVWENTIDFTLDLWLHVFVEQVTEVRDWPCMWCVCIVSCRVHQHVHDELHCTTKHKWPNCHVQTYSGLCSVDLLWQPGGWILSMFLCLCVFVVGVCCCCYCCCYVYLLCAVPTICFFVIAYLETHRFGNWTWKTNNVWLLALVLTPPALLEY